MLEAIAKIILVPITFAILLVNDGIVEPGRENIVRSFKRLRKWGKKKAKQSIVFLLATIIGFILLAVAALVGPFLAVAAFAVTWVILQAAIVAAPPVYALMVIMR